MSKLKDYYIVPKKVTTIDHRHQCIPYYNAFYSTEADAWCLGGAHLPIFIAPMASVIDDKNYLKFDREGLNPIIPRTVPFETRLKIMKEMIWIAVSLSEMDWIYNNYQNFDNEVYICIDLANGHMKHLLDLCKKCKIKFGSKLSLMTGNIANYETYYEYAKAGIDYCRCDIGTGSECLTGTLTGIGQDVPVFIERLYHAKEDVIASFNENREYLSIPKIVIDGGMSSIRDIIVALALGADYVMCGKIFAKCEEACGEIFEKLITIERETICDTCIPKRIYTSTVSEWVPGRIYYGMSTERAQNEMGNKVIKSSEGKEEWVPIEYTVKEWVSKFIAAISSAMSYCDATQLAEFIGKVDVEKYE